MNLDTIIQNLERTIANKDMFLGQMREGLASLPNLDAGSRMALIATKEFLEINVDELKKILADCEAARDV